MKRRMKRKLNFRGFYVIYLTLLILISASVLIYIHSLLQKYENFRPQHYVTEVMEDLCMRAANHTLVETYGLEEPVIGVWEQGVNFFEAYENDFLEDLDIELYKSTGQEAIYTIVNGDFSLARVTLQTKGEPYTRLVILQFQEWEIKSVDLILEPHSYELVLPDDYSLTINEKTGQAEKTEQTGLVKYTFDNLYRKPDIVVKSADAKPIEVRVSDSEIKAVFYEYRMSLPMQIQVYCNEILLKGEKIAENMISYRISDSVKPEVRLEDLYGNSINYDGKGDVTMKCLQLSADAALSVKVDGMDVPEEACSWEMNPEYEFLTAYVNDIPKTICYEIVVLKENPEIIITNESGEYIEAIPGNEPDSYVAGLLKEETFPQELEKQVDVLTNAKNWSLFMSNDLPFSQISSMLLQDSYQYDVAKKYATGVDITFTSAHTLKNPPFTEEKVTNYVRISPNCFSVDISFVKHMSVGAGKAVDDAMNDRFYYVRVDDENEGKWKLAGMKEIVEDEK